MSVGYQSGRKGRICEILRMEEKAKYCVIWFKSGGKECFKEHEVVMWGNILVLFFIPTQMHTLLFSAFLNSDYYFT